MNNEMKTPEEKVREYTDDVIGNYHYVGWDSLVSGKLHRMEAYRVK
ncbi:hypothetical protein [Dysgonomonas sp. Marseille-P4677]|nr:hypothetical protein [Dysgonomonas sp. Marseille-P4677]